MATQFHNRLVGTIVIAALGVIFLPDILDGKKSLKPEQFAEIPLRPETVTLQPDPQVEKVLEEPQSLQPISTADDSAETTTIAAADKPKQETNSVPPAEQPKPTATATATAAVTEKPPEEPKPTVATKPQVAWTLQLGAFSSAANVKGLVAKLRKAGFAAYTLPSTPVEGKLTRVFVGPEVSLDKLQSQQQKVESLTSLKGKVIRFNPLEH
ncbi:SPOR domain-containing protein [Shewanella sp. C32]|uniref:SPOR domain-containing protein n=1 Tax=Shewanella electrica TaxID=515560 RepID=A0ABT2FLR8_9GAMM|nr:SPOR domain-containing protein [Shewanella electrica]MCH1923688.1 SPOR domain-containing protein [Shewanella electrica]MCS4556907.1 SPOR domain-containing protein [Shewanella electrica]